MPSKIRETMSKQAPYDLLEYYVALHHADPLVDESLISRTFPEYAA